MIKKLLLPVLVAAVLLQSCTIEKRHFRPGYHLEWKSHSWSPQPAPEMVSSSPEINEPSPAPTIQEHSVTRLDKTGKNEIPGPDEEAYSVPVLSGVQQDDTCDVVTRMNGDEIRARVTRITETSIEYKRCDIPDGPLYVEKKSAVFMIKYRNGTKEVFAKNEKEDNSEPNEKPLGVLGPLAVLFAVLSIFLLVVADSPVYLVAMLLGLVLGIFGLVQYNGSPGKYSRATKVMAIVGMVICGLGVVLLLTTLL